MQILIYFIFIILIGYIIYKAYLVYSSDMSETERLKQLKNKDSSIEDIHELTTDFDDNTFINIKNPNKTLDSLLKLPNKIKLNTTKNTTINTIEQFKSQLVGDKIVNNQTSEIYLQTLITTVFSITDFDLKDFRLYNNITLDYFDYETSKKTAIKIDNIIISPYGIVTIKNINLKGLSIVDLNFSQDSKSKALQVVSNNANVKAKEYTHPVVESVNQSKALSSFFISKNIPNAYITPIVVYTNVDDEYTQNKVLLKLENGEYSLLNNICKINNLLGSNKNSAYILYADALAPFIIDLKNNKDISRPVNTYTNDDLYSFDLALLSLLNEI